MPILGKVVQSTPLKRAAHKSRLEDVPKAIFGNVAPKALIKTPIAAARNPVWRGMAASLY